MSKEKQIEEMANSKEYMAEYYKKRKEDTEYKEKQKVYHANDVVPKSEVEKLEQDVTRLVQENEALKDSNEHLAVLLSEAKAEVAREIFEDIERKIKALLTLHLEEINKEYIKDTPLYDRHSGIIFALQGMADFIAELKKKYTERCPDCKHFVGCECFDGKTCDEYKRSDE
jgi:hypothetical protein